MTAIFRMEWEIEDSQEMAFYVSDVKRFGTMVAVNSSELFK